MRIDKALPFPACLYREAVIYISPGEVKIPTGLPRGWLRDLFRLVLVLSRAAAVLVLVIVLVIVAEHVAKATRCDARFVSVSAKHRFVVDRPRSTEDPWSRPC